MYTSLNQCTGLVCLWLGLRVVEERTFASVAAELNFEMSQKESSFFERERYRLTTEITVGFEELLSSSNVLNRKLEEALGMTSEYETIATLWQNFHEFMRGQNEPLDNARAVPGTGTHVVSTNSTRRQ
ncbi:hypothetical protein V8B97DRAFT_1916543 [Scleroderma yunnanense]